MTRSIPATAVGILFAAVVLTGCGADRGAQRSAEPRPSPSSSASRSTPHSTEPSVSTSLAPSGGASSAAKPSLANQERLDEQLRAAAWDNDVRRARRLIVRGADVNAKDETEQSAYLIATSEGYLDLLRLTVRSGASINDKDSWNGTGLIRAAERGHGLVVGALLQAGIDRDHVNRIGYQAVHEAVWLGDDTAEYATTVRVLAAGGVQLDLTSPSAGLTPSRWPANGAMTRSSAFWPPWRTIGASRIPTLRSCERPRQGTPMPWPWRCGPARTSRPGTGTTAPPCCWPPRSTGLRSPRSSLPWGLIRTLWTTATTLRGSSRA